MKNRRGFSVIELLVVFAIIAILAAILYPVFARARLKVIVANVVSAVGTEPMLRALERPTVIGSVTIQALPCRRTASMSRDGWLLLVLEGGVVIGQTATDMRDRERACKALVEDLFCGLPSRNKAELYRKFGLPPPVEEE